MAKTLTNVPLWDWLPPAIQSTPLDKRADAIAALLVNQGWGEVVWSFYGELLFKLSGGKTGNPYSEFKEMFFIRSTRSAMTGSATIAMRGPCSRSASVLLKYEDCKCSDDDSGEPVLSKEAQVALTKAALELLAALP